MFEVQEALDAQKEEFARREEAFRRREEGLRQKDLELQESLIKFNKFLQENESKKNRADKRATEEIKLRRIKEEEIVKLQKGLDNMRADYAKLELELEKNRKYQIFLERMQLQYSEEYPEIEDLLKRHQTLTGANEDLVSRQREHERVNEVERAQFAHFTKQGKTNMLNFNNRVAQLQKELEISTASAGEAAELLDTSISKASAETLEVGQVLMAVKNLLQRCTSKQHGENLKHIDIKKQQEEAALHDHHKVSTDPDDILRAKGERAKADLDIIAAYIKDFMAIVSDYQRAHKKGKSGAHAAGSPAAAGVNGASSPQASNGGVGDSAAAGARESKSGKK